MERIRWNYTRRALLEYGTWVCDKMKKDLKAKGHYDTGALDKSLKPYYEEENDVDILYVEMKHYGQYADKWWKKGSVRKVKVNGRMVKKGVRDIPTFMAEWYKYIPKLNDIIAESTAADMEEAIYTYIDDIMLKNK